MREVINTGVSKPGFEEIREINGKLLKHTLVVKMF